MRGGDDIPLTAPKLNYSGSWPDVKRVVDHIYEKYVLDVASGEPKTQLYIFGVSLGANQLGLYLINEGKEAAKKLDGAVLYATPWNILTGWKFFYENMFGLYTYVIGMCLNEQIRSV